jgi:hypothetical protein
LPRVDPFLATGIYRQTRDVAIRVGRGRAEYAKPVYGANCVRLTAADVQKWDQILSIGGFVGKASHALEMCFGSDGDRYTEVTSVIIGHRFAELGKVIGDPLALPAIFNGVALGGGSYLQANTTSRRASCALG